MEKKIEVQTSAYESDRMREQEKFQFNGMQEIVKCE